MSTTQSVKRAQTLLEQISEDPDEVLQVLDEAEQSAMMKELDALAERAGAIQSSADLLGLVDAIHRLVEDRAALRALLLSGRTDVAQQQLQRKITLDDQQATTGLNDYTQQLAPQIRDAVIDCRAQLQAALEKQADLEHKPDQRKSHESA